MLLVVIFSKGLTQARLLDESLFINNVTVADDRANGEFICDIIDFNADTWRRTIRVKVIGKLESATDHGMKACDTSGESGTSLYFVWMGMASQS